MPGDDEPLFNLLAEKVRARRQELGISSGSELGRRAGVDQSLISRIESGKRLPSLDDLAKIAAALKVPAEDLVLLADVDDLGLERVSKLVEYATGKGISPRVVAIMEAAKRLPPFFQDVALALVESGLPKTPWSAGDDRDKEALAEQLFARAGELKSQAHHLEAEAQILLAEARQTTRSR